MGTFLTVLLFAFPFVGNLEAQERYEVDFDNLDFETLIRQTEAITQKSFLYPPGSLKDKKAHLVSSKSLTSDEFYRVFEALCFAQGLSLIDVPDTEIDLVRIVPAETALQQPAGTEVYLEGDELPRGERWITYITEIEHASVKDLQTILEPLSTSTAAKANTISAVPGTQLLMINDLASNIERLARLIAMIDQPGPPPEIRSVTLKHVPPEEMEASLESYVEVLTQAGPPLAPSKVFQVRAEPRLSSLLMVGLKEELDRLEAYVRQVDLDTPSVRRVIRFYKIRHVQVTDLAADISTLVGGQLMSLNTTGGGTTATSNVTPNTPVPSINVNQGTVPAINPGTQNPIPPQIGVPPNIPLGQTDDDDILVIPYVGLNTLIVAATEEIHTQIPPLLEKLDILRPQVLIEVVIAQISGDDNLEFGLSFFGSGGGELQESINFDVVREGLTDNTGSGIPDTASLTEFAGGLVGYTPNDKIQVILKALQTQSDVNIVSQPLLLVNDNEQANFQTKFSEPTTTSTFATSTTNVSFAGFAEAITELKITPHISENDYLVVDISQTFEEFQGEAPAPGIPPAKVSNSLETKVTVPDRATIIVGGFVRDIVSDRVSKVPILGDIPLIGALFSSTKKNTTKSRLYLFIRPTILRDDNFDDLKKLSDEKHREVSEGTDDDDDGTP